MWWRLSVNNTNLAFLVLGLGYVRVRVNVSTRNQHTHKPQHAFDGGRAADQFPLRVCSCPLCPLYYKPSVNATAVKICKIIAPST